MWEHSKARGSARLVLLALADHAGSDGGDCWPSVGRLAERCGVSERTVQHALDALEQLGEITIEEKPGRPNRYVLPLATPAESAPPQNLHPEDCDETPADLADAPADLAPEPPLTKEPSNPSAADYEAEADRQIAQRLKAGGSIAHRGRYRSSIIARLKRDGWQPERRPQPPEWTGSTLPDDDEVAPPPPDLRVVVQ